LPTNESYNANAANLKLALMVLVDKFAAVEDTFVGRLENEIVIDPIAIYREL
jgi:hypothetical protein